MKETDLAQKFVEYLSCYDLYFEVDYHRCVDIVAIEGNISMAYEVKTTFNFKVLEQAIENAKHFHYSYICVPDFSDSYFQRKLCVDYGLGLLVYPEKDLFREVRKLVHPKLNRHANIFSLRNRLREENKQSIPGSRSGDGGKLTAFGCTVQNAEFFVRRNPGCTLKQMIEGIEHHYSSNQSARGSMAQYIKSGVIKNIELKSNKLYFKNYE